MSLSGCFLLQVYAEITEFKNFYPHDLLIKPPQSNERVRRKSSLCPQSAAATLSVHSA